MKQKEYTFDEISNENVNDNDLTEKIVISRHSVGVIMNSIMKLPSIYRDILLFENVYGYTKKELAEILEISAMNIAKRSQRAKEKLSKVLKENGILDKQNERL